MSAQLSFGRVPMRTPYFRPGPVDVSDEVDDAPRAVVLKVRVYRAGDEFSFASLSGSCEVDWGDGSDVSSVSSEGAEGLSHAYSAPGWYLVSVSGAASVCVVGASPSALLAPMVRDVVSARPGAVRFADRCFEGCAYLGPALLARVSGPLYLGARAFAGCTGLVHVLRAENSPVVTPSDGCFEGCTGLLDLAGLSGLSTCPAGCFRGCTSLAVSSPPPRWLSGHDGVIGEECFAGCASLADAGILAGGYVERVGARAFRGCTSLADLSGYADAAASASALLDVPEGAFEGCTSLASLASLGGPAYRSVGAECFRGCTSLASVDLPDGGSIVSFGDRAFEGCTSLAALSASPQSVVSYGGGCFRGCVALGSLDGLPPTLLRIGVGCFAGCSLDVAGDDGALASRTGLADVSALAGTSVSELPDECFLDCRALPSDTFSALEGMGLSAGARCFKGCVTLSEAPAVRCPASSTSVFEGCADVYALPDADGSGFSGLLDASRVRFTDESQSLPDAAFRGCAFLVIPPTIPESCKSVGAECFRGCAHMWRVSVACSASSPLVTFGTRCFADCTWAMAPLSASYDPLPEMIAWVASGFFGSPPFQYAGSREVLASALDGKDRMPGFGGGLSDIAGIGDRLSLWWLKSLKDLSLFSGGASLTETMLNAVVVGLDGAVLDVLAAAGKLTSRRHMASVHFMLGSWTGVLDCFTTIAYTSTFDLFARLAGTATEKDYHVYAPFSGSGFAGCVATEILDMTDGVTLEFRIRFALLRAALKESTPDLVSSGCLDGWYSVSLRVGGDPYRFAEFIYNKRATFVAAELTSMAFGEDGKPFRAEMTLTWTEIVGIDADTGEEITRRLDGWDVELEEFFRIDKDDFAAGGPADALSSCFRMLVTTCILNNNLYFDGGSYYVSVDEAVALASEAFSAQSVADALVAALRDAGVFPPGLDRVFGDYCFENSSSLVFPGACWLPGMFTVPEGFLKGTRTSSMYPFYRWCSEYGSYSFAYTGVSSVGSWPPLNKSVPEGLFLGCAGFASLDGLPAGIVALHASCFEGTGLARLTRSPLPGDDVDGAVESADVGGLTAESAATTLPACTFVGDRAFAGTAITSLTTSLANSLNRDDPAGIGCKVFRDWCEVSVDVINTRGGTYWYRPVIRIRPRGGSHGFFTATREILVLADYDHGFSDDDAAYCEGTAFDGRTFDDCVSGVTFTLLDEYNSGEKCVTNYEATDVAAGKWTSADRYYHYMASSTDFFMGDSGDEVVRLSCTSSSSGLSRLAFTCGPFQFEARFWIQATVDKTDHVATDFEVVGADVTNVYARDGYDPSAYPRAVPCLPSATFLGDGVFADCERLAAAWWPESQAFVSADAFRGCVALKDLAGLPATVTSYGDRSFAGCPFGELPDLAAGTASAVPRKHALEIPSTVTSIGSDCFSFDEYPDADPKLTNLTFLGRTVAEIRGMDGFPWGVPDGCSITTEDGEFAYPEEAEDG